MNHHHHYECVQCEDAQRDRMAWADEVEKEAEYVDGMYSDMKRQGMPVARSCVKRLKALAKKIRGG